MKTVSRVYYRSSSFKMAALFTLLLGASACLLGYYLYDFGRTNFIRETEAAIDNEIEHILVATGQMTQDERQRYIAERFAVRSHPVYYYQDVNAQRLAGNIEQIPPMVTRLAEGVLRFSLPLDGTAREMASKIHTFADGSRLLIARDIDDIIRNYDRLMLISAVIIIFMLVVVATSFFISVFVVRRINRIAHTAQEMMDTGDLSRRIQIDTSWDDLSNLAQTLNSLLARIEQLMQGIRDVSDNIAHDLRTPLTRLRNRLEELKQKESPPEGVAMLLAEADGLLHSFNALLRIANVEKGKRHQAFAPVELHSILHDVVELYEPLAEAKRVGLYAKIETTPSRPGDRDLLFQALANLLDNAIKFSPKNSSIDVAAKTEKEGTVITIADGGPGIAVNERERVFERFYRVDKSRHTSGSGLGLSLVRAIIELHKGAIRLEDNQPGLQVHVTL